MNRKAVVRWHRRAWMFSGVLFSAWLVWGFQTVALPEGTFVSGDGVAVERAGAGNAVHFKGTGTSDSGAGLIFLSGGAVDPAAYAPLMRQVAASGRDVHLMPLPWRCACTASQEATLFDAIRAIARSEPKRKWILAGHSRGAMLASKFVRDNTTAVAGMALLATTHPRDFDLSALKLPIVKIYGTADGVASPRAVTENLRLLPKSTQLVAIEGGNHVQFGYYRHQLGDNGASIPREAQQKAVLDVLTTFLRTVDAAPQR